ncbi:NAD(P)H-binding protein [Streptomyces pimonensis]|uniref:NAD(P)H-binding protein n=1 Tax=Streptomyces pimonensis TaxID=2860288 RepID=A0ABV4J6H7_9ACTN
MATQDLTLVIGATGNVGRRVVRHLVDEGHRTRAFVREPESAALPETVEVAQGDLTVVSTLDRALSGVDSVFLLWPYLTLDDAPAVVDAIAAHARRVVYLSSAGILDDQDEQIDPINRFHAGIERLIEKSGLEWTFLRCGSFAATVFDWADQIREGVVREAFGNAARVMIHEADIAAVAVRALTGEGHNGRKYVLTGPEAVTQVEQVRLVSEAIGRPVRFEEITADELRRNMLAEGWQPADIEGLIEAYIQMSTVEQPTTTTVKDITGRPARTFREWAADHAQDFR